MTEIRTRHASRALHWLFAVIHVVFRGRKEVSVYRGVLFNLKGIFGIGELFGLTRHITQGWIIE